MWLTLLGTAFFMGLVGGVHCLAMCAVPCGFITSNQNPGERVITIQAVSRQERRAAGWLRVCAFHSGRLLGYAVLGAVAAVAVGQLAWFSDRTTLLHPLWVGMHLVAWLWGWMLVFQASQPQWVETLGRRAWGWLQRGLSVRGGVWAAGALWALMPCGLLYSAVMVAALAGGALSGAAVMLCFGLGTMLWLLLGPWALRMVGGLARNREQTGLRVAGALLVIIASWALWMDLVHKPAQWCR